jgi:hypothetical protein
MFIRTNANGGKDRNKGNHDIFSRFLVAGIDDQIAYFAQGSVALDGQLIIQQFVTRLTSVISRLTIPNSFMTASASRVEIPLIYI